MIISRKMQKARNLLKNNLYLKQKIIREENEYQLELKQMENEIKLKL